METVFGTLRRWRGEDELHVCGAARHSRAQHHAASEPPICLDDRARAATTSGARRKLCPLRNVDFTHLAQSRTENRKATTWRTARVQLPAGGRVALDRLVVDRNSTGGRGPRRETFRGTSARAAQPAQATTGCAEGLSKQPRVHHRHENRLQSRTLTGCFRATSTAAIRIDQVQDSSTRARAMPIGTCASSGRLSIR